MENYHETTFALPPPPLNLHRLIVFSDEKFSTNASIQLSPKLRNLSNKAKHHYTKQTKRLLNRDKIRLLKTNNNKKYETVVEFPEPCWNCCFFFFLGGGCLKRRQKTTPLLLQFNEWLSSKSPQASPSWQESPSRSHPRASPAAAAVPRVGPPPGRAECGERRRAGERGGYEGCFLFFLFGMMFF